MSQRPLRSMATTSSLQDPTNGIIFKFPFSQPLTTSSLPNEDWRFPRQPPRQPPERNFVNIAPLLDSTLDFETTYIENSLHVPDDEDDFKNNQTTYLTVIDDADDVSDEASSIESSQDDLFSEIDKAVALKRKEFVKQGLLKPNLAKEDIVDVIHAELQPYEVDDAEEIEQLKGLAVNSDETPEDLLGSNSDSLFDLDFDSLVKSKKARIVEPRFQMTLAELLDESKIVPVSVYGNLEVDISGIQHDSRLATSGDTGKFVFTTGQILRMAKKLGQLAMLDSLQLLHFNIGYQIPITELLAAGVGEASHIYCELLRFGAQMKVFYIGGGLGIDYDGSKSADSDIFVVHDLEEYVVAVVQAVKDVCDCRSAKHPVIGSDSGRAIASHHSKPSKSDMNYESGLDPELSLNIYVQRDERFGHLKMSDFLAYTLKSIVQILKLELEFLFDSPPKEFDSFEDVLKLCESGMDVPEGLLKDVRDNIHGEMLKVIFSTVGEKFLKFHGFPTKKVIS